MEALNTRDHLLQVGLRRIHAMGYAATGLKEILDEAQVPKGSFYHYFSSKEEFAGEVLKLYVQGEVERLQKILGDKKVTPLKRLRRYFEELISVYGATAEISGCLMGNLSLEMADHSQLIQGLLHEAFNGWQAAIEEVLQEARQAGDLPRTAKPRILAAFLINSYQGALLRSKAEQSNQPLETFLDLTFGLLLKK